MNKHILWVLLCWLSLLAVGAQAQTTLAQETFEAVPADFGYSSNAFSLDIAEYFQRRAFNTTGTVGAYPGTTQVLNNRQGSNTWTGEGVMGIATNVRPPGYVALNPITNSQNYKDFVITVAFAAPRGGSFTGAGADQAFPADRIRIQYSFNGGPWTTAAMLMGNANSGGDLQRLVSLADSTTTPTPGNGTVLDQTFRDITATLPSTALGSNLRVRVVLAIRSVEVAFDNIRVTGVLDNAARPTLTNLETTPASYTEGGSAVLLTSLLTVGYSDNSATNLTGGTVSIGGYVSGQDVLSFTNQNGIVGSFSPVSGVLTLSGTASQAAYQAALRSVRYSNSNTTTATGGTRVITFQVYTGGALSSAASRNLTVTAILNTPAALNYTEDFTTDGEGTRYSGNSFVSVAQQTGFFRATNSPATSGGNPVGTATFTGWSGGYWFGEGTTEGINNPTAPLSTLQLAPVNTTGRSLIKFTLAVGAAGNWRSYINAANPEDGFELYYRINGGTPVIFGAFHGAGGTARLDTDNNPLTTATGTALSTTLQDFTFDLPAATAGVGNLDFLLVQKTRGSTELAFDNIRITGVALPTVTTAAPTSVTGTSAILGGEVTADGGANVTERGVVYSTSNTTPTITDTKDTNGSGTGTFTETITGLPAATTYYVRAYATNAAGTSYGTVQTFTTQTSVVSIVRASGTPTNAAQVNYTVTFANPVTGVSVNNFGLTFTGSFTTFGSVSSVSGSGTTYTVTVNTGAGSGTLQLTMPNSTGMLPGVSGLPYTSGETYTIDKTGATTIITSTAPNPTSVAPIPFAVTFSESVIGFVGGDVTVGNGTITTGSFSGSGASYTFTVTPTAAGTVTVNVPAGVAQDAAGNVNNAATQVSRTYTPPTATVTSVTRLTPSPTATTTVSYRVTFSGSVTGLSLSNFSLTTTGLTGASIASVSGAGTTYTVVVNTGTGNGTLTLNVQNGSGISPTVTNVPYTSGEQYTITKEFTAAPQLVLRSAGSASGAFGDVTAFVDVVQVLQGGAAFTGGLANSSFESSNVGPFSFQYASTVVASPWSFAGNAGVSRNNSGFGSTANQGDAVGLLQTFGGVGGSLAQTLAVPTGSYQVSFQAVQRANNGPSDQVVRVFLNNGTDDVFLGAVQPTSNSAYQAFTSAAFNVTAPALTATVSSSAAAPGGTTNTAPIPFSVTFSQSVGSTFTAADVTVTNGTVGSFAGSGAGPYTFSVTPTTPGTATTVSVAAGVAQDANNTPNTASNSYTLTYIQLVTAAPVITAPANNTLTNQSVTISGTAPAGSSVVIYASQNNGAFQPLTPSLTATAGGTFSSAPVSFSTATYRIYATAQSPGAAVSADSPIITFTVDQTRPAVAISSTAGASGSATTTTPIPFTVTFSENVTGFVAGDVTVTGGTIVGNVVTGTSPGTTYTFAVTPTTPGTPATVNVPANVAQDAASNFNTASPSSYSITYNLPQTAAPVVTTPANGSSVATNTPTFTGTAPAGSTVTVYVDGTSRGTTTADGSGNWLLPQPTPLATGSHTVYATAQLSGQSVSPNSNTNTFTVLNAATYTSSTADQPTTARVVAGSTNQEILRVAVVIGGGPAQPLSAQSFSFTTNGSTNPADIAAARVYYTGTSGTFATTTLFGGNVTAPNGSFTISGSQQLSTGTNYFFLVYDVAANATNGNLLDATVSGVRVSGIDRVPTVTDPAGNRRIVAPSREAGNALRLTGGSTQGYVDFSANTTSLVPLGGQYTQEVWMKPIIGTGSDFYGVLGNGSGNSAAPYIGITGNGRIEAGFGTGTTVRSVRTNPNTLTSGTWNHVVATFNGSVLTIYLNGESVATLSTSDVPANTRVSYVGGLSTTGTAFYPGDIDEISQWNRALTATEIRQLRHLVRSGLETGLVSYLQFNESGSTTTDMTGSVGTLTGAGITRVASTAPVGFGTSSRQTVATNGTVAFTGTSTIIAFAGVSGSSEVVVTRLGGQPLGTQPTATGLVKTYPRAYWIINRYGTGTISSANITYTLGAVDISPADAASPANLKLFVRGSNSDAAFDAPISATSANADAGTVTFAVTSFGQTVIGTNGSSPLPVELTSFTAEHVGEDGLLRWTTAQEKNNAYFEVQSSIDGVTFRALGRVEGHGSTAQPHSYQLTDRNLHRYGSPVIYYRLHQVDTDGQSNYSGIIVLKVALGSVSVDVFPNPAADQLTLRLGGLDARNVQVQLFDAQGRAVLKSRQPASGSDFTLSVGHLPNGVYMLRLVLPDRVLHRSVVISR
ncbi:Ig-like domain-containing protein [Hymenobacter koreensis]|uniref:Fibronectin type-III domain-containing protein n=1 Tax=Hymenobacter koreensis TaxID=1084523 RepID=A0ABP8JNB6_9BACT